MLIIKNGLNKIIKINVEAPETDCTGLAFFNRRLKHNIFDVMIKIIDKYGHNERLLGLLQKKHYITSYTKSLSQMRILLKYG